MSCSSWPDSSGEDGRTSGSGTSNRSALIHPQRSKPPSSITCLRPRHSPIAAGTVGIGGIVERGRIWPCGEGAAGRPPEAGSAESGARATEIRLRRLQFHPALLERFLKNFPPGLLGVDESGDEPELEARRGL